jgi:hypothetical protein
MPKSGTSVRRLRSSRTHRSKLPRTTRRAAGPIVGHNVPGPSAPVEKTPALASATAVIALAGLPTTRASLAAAVKERFRFSIDGLWDWLVQEKRLPPTLPEDWDPILGDGGVYAHWRDSGHDILPTPTIDVPKRHLGFPNKARAKTRRTCRKQACRLCGVASVLWRCWLATRPRRLGYVEQYESTLAELGRSVAKADEAYVDATEAFITSHDARLRELRSESIALLEDAEKADRVGRRDAKKRVRVQFKDRLLRDGLSPIKKLGIHKRLSAVLRSIVARMDILRQITVGFSRNDLGQPQRWAGSGRQPELITAVWKTLWDHGFTYREIGEKLACPDDKAIDYAALVRDRIHPRFHPPKQHRSGDVESGESATFAVK